MTNTHTAPQRHSVARLWARSQRFAIATAISAAITLAAFAPAAAAKDSPACRNANTPVTATSTPDLQKAVVCLINAQRTQRHLPGLHANQRLNRSAQSWTNAMVRHAAFTHGADFSARITAVGFDWSTVGENIATGYATPAQVVSGWMASTGHCQNILNPKFAEVGTGVLNHPIHGSSTSGGTWTQDFGQQMGAHAHSTNWAPASGCPYARA